MSTARGRTYKRTNRAISRTQQPRLGKRKGRRDGRTPLVGERRDASASARRSRRRLPGHVVEPREGPARVPEPPEDEEDEDGRAGEQRHEQKAPDPRAEEHDEPDNRPRQAVDTPHDGLHPELTPIVRACPECRREGVPQLRKDADERSPDERGAKIRERPART